jgi:hypothetical protein
MTMTLRPVQYLLLQFVVLFLTTIYACNVQGIHYLSSVELKHYACIDCELKACCDAIAKHQQDKATTFSLDACIRLIAAVPSKKGWFSYIFSPRISNSNQKNPKSLTENVFKALKLFVPEDGTDEEALDDLGDREGKATPRLFPMDLYPETFTGKISSELRQAGGMHRTLSLHLDLSELPPTSAWNGFVDVLVFLTENWFVDEEQFLETCRLSSGEDEHDCSDSVILHTSQSINMEEPAFVSPQHVLKIRVSIEGKWVNDTFLDIDLALALHCRYPNPSDNSARYVVASLPVPILLQGQLDLRAGDADLKHSHLKPVVIVDQPMVAHVPTGQIGDLGWVSIVTALCSLAGSIVMLKALLQAHY